MSQAALASELNAGVSTVASWEVGKRFPSRDNMEQLADTFNVDLAYLYGESELRQRVHIDTEEISEDMAKTGDFFALQIKGDSMESRIYDGDVVIVRQQEDADSGDIVIAMVNGYDATCKRLVKYATSLSLVSLNSKYEPMMFTEEEVATKPVRIIGKVVELRGEL